MFNLITVLLTLLEEFLENTFVVISYLKVTHRYKRHRLEFHTKPYTGNDWVVDIPNLELPISLELEKEIGGTHHLNIKQGKTYLESIELRLDDAPPMLNRLITQIYRVNNTIKGKQVLNGIISKFSFWKKDSSNG